MSPAAEPNPPTRRAVPTPPRRALLAIGVVWAAVMAGWAVAVAVTAPPEPVGDAAFGREFLAACTRSGGDADACDCAWERWQDTVDPAERRALDEALAAGGELPATVDEALAAC